MAESTVRLVVDEFIRLLKREVDPDAVLVAFDDVFEVPKKLPSVIAQGPALTENLARRAIYQEIDKNIEEGTYTQRAAPRLYHLDFDIIITAANQGDLLEMIEKVAAFYQRNPELTVQDRGTLNVTELDPPGSWRRVNLSDLKQATGRCRIEDCPVWTDQIVEGKLILTRTIQSTVE